jgi:hypothetical protein
LAIASRIAARSTTQGTPVKSCSSTRAGRYWISALLDGFFCQSTRAFTSSAETVKPPSSKRSRFSSSTFIEKGKARDIAELFGGLLEGVVLIVSPPTVGVLRVPSESCPTWVMAKRTSCRWRGSQARSAVPDPVAKPVRGRRQPSGPLVNGAAMRCSGHLVKRRKSLNLRDWLGCDAIAEVLSRPGCSSSRMAAG